MSIIDNIKKMSDNNKKHIIDYMEGMPDELISKLKFSINDIIGMNKKIKIHKTSSVIKFLNKKSYIITDNATYANIQSEYSNILTEINNSKLDPSIKSKLKFILDSKCYNNETILNVEIDILKFVETYKIDKNVIELIFDKIMPYKFKVYDTYSFLILYNNSYDIEFTTNLNSCCLLSDIDIFIRHEIEKNETYLNEINIASFIHTYFNEIGAIDILDKFDIYKRFDLYFQIKNKSREYIDDIRLDIISFSNTNSKTSNVSNMTFDSKLENIIKNKDFIIGNEMKDVIENNGYLLIFRNYDVGNNADKITQSLRLINKEEILKYVDIDKNNLSLSITENDYGYIKKNISMKIGVAINKFDNTTKYIMLYEDIFYLIFRDLTRPDFCYGLSLSINNNSRNLITIKKNKKYFYKYIDTI